MPLYNRVSPYSLPAILLTLTCLAASVSLGGCSGGKVDGVEIASAQEAYDAGLAAFQAERYAEAKEKFDQALTGGGLDADHFVSATLKRAICLADAGDFAAAEADLREAEQGATDMAQVHVTRGFIKAKQGDEAGASAEFREAKKLDPKIELPKI
ncbi:hypothetical protein SH139x_000101 [Planctomycetaceae bacterium SH139]